MGVKPELEVPLVRPVAPQGFKKAHEVGSV